MAVPNETVATESKLKVWGSNLVDQIIRAGINGAGPMKGAAEVAEEHLAHHTDREKAISKLISTHVRLAAASGFVTGLGGVVTLPVTVPASVAGLYLLGARMSLGIAHLRGYDIESEEVRSAVLISLLGSGGTKLVPLVGAPVGAAFDGVGCKTIATFALRMFEPLERVDGSCEGVVIDGEVLVENRSSSSDGISD